MAAAIVIASTMMAGEAYAQGGSLKPSEYTCAGSGGTILIGLGFKVLPGNRYTDLDGKSPGTYSIEGTNVKFRGGHLDGQVGWNLRGNNFNIKSAGCTPF